ncbi:SLOG family protein [Streptomyces sp. NPDC005407]|uniref:SLOG family protein n=1 Tax=Streptomyces sp. NPDC005407 TaxID=3155340 RepID=UPI0033A07FB5
MSDQTPTAAYGEDLARIGLTGSRTWPDRALLEATLMDVWHDATQLGYRGILLTHGACEEGADDMGDDWAFAHGVPQDPHRADWRGPCAPNCPTGHRRRGRRGEYCPMAGHRRNQLIVDLRPLLLVAAHHNQSTGTADCMRRADAAGIPVRRIVA